MDGRPDEPTSGGDPVQAGESNSGSNVKLTPKEKSDLVKELRPIYKTCEELGKTPSPTFVTLAKILKAEVEKGAGSDDETEHLYHNQTRDEIETWLEAVEANIENEGRGGTDYSDKEKQFVEDMRSRFHERGDWVKPLTGKQLRWLKALYDRS